MAEMMAEMAGYLTPPGLSLSEPETATASRERRRVTLATKVAVEEVTRMLSTRFDIIEQKLDKVVEDAALLSRVNRLEVLLGASPSVGPSLDVVLSKMLQRAQNDEMKVDGKKQEPEIEMSPEKIVEAPDAHVHELGLQLEDASSRCLMFDLTIEDENFTGPESGTVAQLTGPSGTGNTVEPIAAEKQLCTSDKRASKRVCRLARDLLLASTAEGDVVEPFSWMPKPCFEASSGMDVIAGDEMDDGTGCEIDVNIFWDFVEDYRRLSVIASMDPEARSLRTLRFKEAADKLGIPLESLGECLKQQLAADKIGPKGSEPGHILMVP